MWQIEEKIHYSHQISNSQQNPYFYWNPYLHVNSYFYYNPNINRFKISGTWSPGQLQQSAPCASNTQKWGFLQFNKVQNYTRQRDHRIGCVSKMKIGIEATYCKFNDINLKAADLDDKIRWVSENKRANLPVGNDWRTASGYRLWAPLASRANQFNVSFNQVTMLLTSSFIFKYWHCK